MNALKHLEESCESIDASVFSGELLFDVERTATLKEYIGRWTRAIQAHEECCESDGQHLVPADQDPFFQARKQVSGFGFVANTPELLFGVLDRLGQQLQHAEDLQLLARIWRPKNPLLMRIAKMDRPLTGGDECRHAACPCPGCVKPIQPPPTQAQIAPLPCPFCGGKVP